MKNNLKNNLRYFNIISQNKFWKIIWKIIWVNKLKSNKLINLDILGNYSLTSDGIIYMEHRFQNKVDKVIDYISKLIP